METRNKGLIVFGIVFLVIGLVASFYQVTQRVGQPPMLVEDQIFTPYQNVGIILLIAGIVFLALGLIPPQKTMQKILSPQS